MLHKILSMNRLLNEAHTDEKERTKRRQLQTYSKRSLGSGLNRRLVALPPGEDRDAWLAANTMDFYEAVSSLVGIAADESSSKQLPGWGFPPGYEYLWIGEGLRRPVKCSGAEYIENVMNWVEKVLNDPDIFPTSAFAGPYPVEFQRTCKLIFKRLFRVFAILYTQHYHIMESRGAVAHLNTIFKHFLFFCFEFDMVPAREFDAIDCLVQRLREDYDVQDRQP